MVLLAAYNGAPWICEQVNTILTQDSVDVEIYVSVDWSADATIVLLEALAATDPRVNVLPYGERFGGAARNFFRLIKDVDFSASDYVAFSDQDDIWLRSKLLSAIGQIESKLVDAYSSNVIAFWENGRARLIKKSHQQKSIDFLYESAGPGCTYVFRARSLALFKCFLLENWNSINSIELHDWLIYAYFRSRTLGWHIDSASLILYRQHASNQFGANAGLKAILKRLLKVKSKWYRGEVEKIAKVLGMEIPQKAFMVKNFFQLRRRTRDAFLLLFFVLSGLY